MSWKNLCLQIDPMCTKRTYTKEEYQYVKSISIRINATDLYRMYGKGMPYREFYLKLKSMLYYDKYVCEHGTEYCYYVKMNNNIQESFHYDDVLYVIPAI
jgi:hypothetical protein